MDSYKLSLKLFASNYAGQSADVFVPVFQAWIRDQALVDHLLIDVADYAHVPTGPGTVLVSHEANIHFDMGDGHPGLLYIRKQPISGATVFRDRLATVFHATLLCADLLAKDSTLGGLAFNTNEFIFRINDRLAAPNTAATFADVKADLQAFAEELFRSDVTLEHKLDAQRLFEVRIKSKSNPPVAELLARLGQSTAPAR